LPVSAYTPVKKRTAVPSSTNPLVVLRAKTLKVSCSKIEIKEIVKPILKATSLVLLSEKASELPELIALAEILYPAKVLMAKILTLATQETFLPEELSALSATVCGSTGQCKILVNHTRNTLDRFTQPYSVIFLLSSDLDIYHAYMVRHKNIHPVKLKEQLTRL